jgi:hypothetical protein
MKTEEELRIEKNEKIFEKIVEDVTKNHHRIIDDWCKAYLAHLVEEGIELKPNCFTLFHKQPSPIKGDMVHEYWFELREKQETANDKLLKQVMERLHSLIMYVHDRMKECRGKSDKTSEMLILHEIEGFLNFVDKENEEVDPINYEIPFECEDPKEVILNRLDIFRNSARLFYKYLEKEANRSDELCSITNIENQTVKYVFERFKDFFSKTNY